MKVFKFFADFDKEEQWLRDMARQGYHFVKKGFSYKFVHGEPSDTQFRIDFRKFKRQSDYEDYCALFEDSGWERMVGTKSSGYQYFKKNNTTEDIFSDTRSKAGRYKRLSEMWMTLFICYLPLFIIFGMTGKINISELADFKSLYYTPGLWEKSGAAFWMSFIFETPFVLMRNLIWLVIPVTLFMYIFFAFQASLKYRRVYNGHYEN